MAEASNRTQRAARDKRRVGGGAAWTHDDPRLRSALRRLDAHGFAWEDVAGEILPVFERARPSSYPVDPPALTVLPPGVTVGFGVDAGPAFMRVSTTHVAHWPVDLAGLAERALDNLDRRARTADERDLLRDTIADVPVVVFQSRDGWASTAVLVPEPDGPSLRAAARALRRAVARPADRAAGRRRPGVRHLADRGIRGGRSERAYGSRGSTGVTAPSAAGRSLERRVAI